MDLMDLKKANMEALKNHDTAARAAISLAYDKAKKVEIEKKAKGQEFTEADIIQAISKSIKELEEEILTFKTAGRAEKVAELEAQKATLEKYLPKQMSEEEIRSEIEKLEVKNMPTIMKHFKMNFAGKVDMSMVSKIAGEYK